MTDDHIVDPDDLNPETVREVKHGVDGYLKQMGDRDGMNEYRKGKYDAYSNVSAMLTRFLEESNNSTATDEE